VTFGPPGVDNTQVGDFCNSEEGLAAIASQSSVSAVATPTTARPIRPTFTLGNTAIGPSITSTAQGGGNTTAAGSHSPKARNIGIGVGVSVGTGVVLLIIGFVLFRRRKSKGTVGPLILVSRQKDEEKKGGVKTMAQPAEGRYVESSANSIHSDPPPAYTERSH
jgi:hypothetical protein